MRGHALRGGQRIVGDFGDEPTGMGALGAKSSAEQGHFLEHRFRQQAGKPLAAGPPGHNAHPRLGQRQRGPRRDHPQVAGRGQFQPAAKGMRLQHRDGRA